MTPVDATSNSTSFSKAITSSVQSVANNDPIGNLSNSARVNQQQLYPTAVTNKFLNPISQSPVPQILTSVTLNDVRQTSVDISDGIDGDPPPFAIFGFGYTGTLENYVAVELCTTIFVDEVDLAHAYPIGGSLFIQNIGLERIKNANTLVTNADGTHTYNPNQANQDWEWLIFKDFEGGASHTIIVQFYWRAILNQGGQKLS